MSTSTVRLDFADLLSPEERELFAANAKVAGRKPSQHLRHLLLGERKVTSTTSRSSKKGARKP